MSGSESQPNIRINACAQKRNDYNEHFTHNNRACEHHPYKTTLPHEYIH